MDILLTTTPKKNDCLVLGFHGQNKLSPAASALSTKERDLLQAILKLQDLPETLGETLLVPMPKGSLTDRILLVKTGESNTVLEKDYRKIIQAIFAALKKTSATSATVDLQGLHVKGQAVDWLTRQFMIQAEDSFYEFNAYSQKKSTLKLKTLSVLIKDTDKKPAQKGIQEGQAIADGMTLCKDLANTPPNICTPIYLEKSAKQLATRYKTSKHKLSVSALDEVQMKKLGMGSLLSVSHGSNNPPRLIVMEYNGASKKEKPLTFVGKGITFDTGGNSLKSGEGMIGMKYDMCGGATVIGLMNAAVELQLPVNLVGVIAAAENMPGASATRPEDIVTSMSGQTIEILNTDAEGRLVLCDALTYCKKFNPEVVIDIATLTGAVLIALGTHRSGLFSNCDALSKELFDLGEHCGDVVWPLPLDEEYNKTLDSKIADMQNISKVKGGPGSTTAACFLSRFTKDYTWAHLDVAGTATTEHRTASGRPLSLLMHYVLKHCEAKHAR